MAIELATREVDFEHETPEHMTAHFARVGSIFETAPVTEDNLEEAPPMQADWR